MLTVSRSETRKPRFFGPGFSVLTGSPVAGDDRCAMSIRCESTTFPILVQYLPQVGAFTPRSHSPSGRVSVVAGPVVRTVTPGAPSRSAVNLSNQAGRCPAMTTRTVIVQQWASQSERGQALPIGRRGQMSTQPKGLCPRQARKSEQPPKHHGENGSLYLKT